MFVRTPLRQVLLILLTAVLALTSCNLGAEPAPTTDLNVIGTAVVSTALAQFSAAQTQTALAAPTSLPTNTSAPITTVVLPGNGTVLPTATVSFNTVLNSTPTTPLAGFTPLATSIGAPTASLGDACNNNTFIMDVTIPDGTIFRDENERGGRPGSEFHKVWRVQNTGNCKWDEGYALEFIGGDDELEPHTLKFEPSNADIFVDPGEVADLSVHLVAPKFPGKYQGTWRMRADNGSYFGTPLSVYIEVEE